MDRLLNPEVLALIGAVLALIWGFIKAKDVIKNKTVQIALEGLELGVEEAWQTYVKALKAANEDGKLTDEERKNARELAISVAKEYCKTKGVDLLKAFAKEYIPVIIKKLVDQRKLPKNLEALSSKLLNSSVGA